MARYCVFFLLGACLLLAAGEPVALAILGASASAALRYNMDGVAARTFTAPAAAVRSASLAALERMGLALDSTSRFDSGETIFARAENRDIEIDIEPITQHATRVRITAKGGSLLYDNATAVERRQRALGGADGERLVLLLLLFADLLELVGDVVQADVAHEALELDEALERLALDRERVRVEIDQVLRQ